MFHEGNKYTMPTDAAHTLGLPVVGPTWSDDETGEIVRGILHKNATERAAPCHSTQGAASAG